MPYTEQKTRLGTFSAYMGGGCQFRGKMDGLQMVDSKDNSFKKQLNKKRRNWREIDLLDEMYIGHNFPEIYYLIS